MCVTMENEEQKNKEMAHVAGHLKRKKIIRKNGQRL